MNDPAQRERLDQTRLELSLAAGAGERANRPTALVGAAIIALVLAAAYALWSLWGRQEALGRVESARDRAREALTLAQRLTSAAKSRGTVGLAPDPRMVGKLDAKARELGITERLTISESDDPTFSVPGMGQKKYIVSFTGHPPERLFQWLQSVAPSATPASDDFAGLQVQRLDLRPGQPVEIKDADGALQQRLSGWTMNIDLVRWERKP